MDSMDMGTTTMNHDTMMHMTTTAAMSTATGGMGGMEGMEGMDHSSHGGMDMGSGPACKVSVSTP